MNSIVNKNCILTALSFIKTYLSREFDTSSIKKIENELNAVAKINFSEVEESQKYYAYAELQKELATLNEKGDKRKLKGVYYTPNDIVNFILINSVKFFYGELESDNLNQLPIRNSSYENFCYDCTFFDPTCGAGVFLLSVLEMKFNLLESNVPEIKHDDIYKILSAVFGNDIDSDSLLITKLRLFLCVLKRYGVNFISGLSDIFDKNFSQCDFVSDNREIFNRKYDIIIGNPPYVEDSKAQSIHSKKYGNIYANILSNASCLLKNNGVIGFILPLSYISTPRMKKIREELFQRLPQQYILSFADRPDCLFVSVHQKLCILLAGNKKIAPTIFTSNYTYWYKEERKNLFERINIVQNAFYGKEFIPKMGTALDLKIYEKILSHQKSLAELFVPQGIPIYLNMRTTYWIKAFFNEHLGAEYKIFKCIDEERADLSLLLLNSSLFWWYWVCVSDCWHITNKELVGFKFPEVFDSERIKNLVTALENRLEATKKYVGTKQTKYEYKHKYCVKEIQEIDDYVNALYNLVAEESFYIKNFAYRYRTSGGGVKS